MSLCSECDVPYTPRTSGAAAARPGAVGPAENPSLVGGLRETCTTCPHLVLGGVTGGGRDVAVNTGVVTGAQ